jgi:hypothetical protein
MTIISTNASCNMYYATDVTVTIGVLNLEEDLLTGRVLKSDKIEIRNHHE